MSARRRRRRNLNLFGVPTLPGATFEYGMVPPVPTAGDGWYPASTVQVPPPGTNGSWVYWPGGEFGWLYSAGTVAPTQVRIDATQNGGPTGLMVHATPTVVVAGHEGGFTEVLAPFSQGSSVRTTAGAPVRSVNPEPSCTIDLDALRLSCPGTPLDGATVVEIGEANGDLVTASFIDPVDGMTKSGRFPIASYQGTPWWKHDGHCCEECALGNDCEGGECSLDRVPNPKPRRPVFARR